MLELERELRGLGEAIAFPPTPELAASVRARLPEREPARRPPRFALAAAVVGAALVAGLAIPQARSAILRVFGVGSVHLEYVDRLPAVEPQETLDLGPEISPQDAPFRLLQSPLLGEPDAVYATGNVATLLYGSPDQVRLLVTEIDARVLESDVVKKVLASTTNTRVVYLADSNEPALWMAGEPHILVLPNAPPRLAANTFVWTQDGITLRLEGAETLEEAIDIADSFE